MGGDCGGWWLSPGSSLEAVDGVAGLSVESGLGGKVYILDDCENTSKKAQLPGRGGR